MADTHPVESDYPSPLPAWDDVQESIRREFPNVAPEVAQDLYEQARAQSRFANMQSEPIEEHVFRMIPGSSVREHRIHSDYGAARTRIANGVPMAPEPPNALGLGGYIGDYNMMAAYEARQRVHASRSTAESIGTALETIPAMAGEAVAGGRLLGAAGIGGGSSQPIFSATGGFAGAGVVGENLLGMAGRTAAQTAVMPSMWLPEWAQRNVENGREATDWRGLPPAFAMGFLNTAVLGSLGSVGNSITTPGVRGAAQRLLTRTATGLLEQQGVDVFASAVSEVLPKAYQLKTDYGLVGDLVRASRGEESHFWRNALTQAVTFAAFSVLHGTKPHDAVEPIRETLNEQSRLGAPSFEAASALAAEAQARIHGVQDAGPRSEQATSQGETPYNRAFEQAKQSGMADAAAHEYAVRTMQHMSEQPATQSTAAPEAYTPVQAATPVQAPEVAPAGQPEPVTMPGRMLPEQPEMNRLGERGRPSVREGYIPEKPPAPPQPFQGLDPQQIKDVVKQVIPGSKAKTPEQLVADMRKGGYSDDAIARLSEAYSQTAGGPVQPAAGPVAPAQQIAQPEPMPAAEQRTAAPEPQPSPRMTEAERQAEIARLTQEQSVDSRSNTVPKERTSGYAEINVPELDAADLPQKQKQALQLLLGGASLREAEKTTGVSYESVRNRANRAFEKLKVDSPKFLEGIESLKEWRDELQLREAERLARAPAEAAEATRDTGTILDHVAAMEEQAREAQTEIGAIHEDISRLGEQSGRSREEVQRDVEAALREALEVAQKQSSGPATESPPPGAGTAAATATAATAQPEPAVPANTNSPVENAPIGKVAGPAPEKPGILDKVATEIGRNLGVGLSEDAPMPKTYIQLAKQAVSDVNSAFNRLAGATAPRTTALAPEAADSIARHANVSTYAERATPYYVDAVLGPLTKGMDAKQAEQVRILYGTALQEMRHRYARDAFNKKAAELWQDAQKEKDTAAKRAMIAESAQYSNAAREVQSFIGADRSPLNTEADYQRVVKSGEFQGLTERWKEEMVPVMEGFFKKAQGMEAEDPINSLTQIPGLPMNAKPVQLGDSTGLGNAISFSSSGEGNLTGQRQPRLKFSKEFGGNAAAYDTDLGAIIENSLRHSSYVATKAEMYRSLVENNLAQWGRRGQKLTINGNETVEIPEVKPGKGTQTNAADQQHLYVDARIYHEVADVLATDRSFMNKLGARAVQATANAVNKVTLAALAEGTSHATNLATFIFKPGVGSYGGAGLIWELPSTFWGVLRKDPATMKRLTDLAEVGAMKQKGFEAASMYEGASLNPLTWISKTLDVLDSTMRLTAEDAFNRLAKQGRVNPGEGNMRDFVNQLGNYNKKTQNQWVAFFRELGIGPFATAGTNYTMQGLRALTMNPGVQATSLGHALGLRGEMLARTLAFLAVAPIANYLLWKDPQGDENTPLGAIRTGNGPNGETNYIDLARLTGVSRGARLTGLAALLEGRRAGASNSDIVERGIRQSTQSMLHPIEGPIVSTAHIALTGRNLIDMRVAKEPLNPDAAVERRMLRLQAALWNMNPMVQSATGAARPERFNTSGGFLGSFGQSIGYPASDMPAGQRAIQASGLGLGLKTRQTPPGRPQGRVY